LFKILKGRGVNSSRNGRGRGEVRFVSLTIIPLLFLFLIKKLEMDILTRFSFIQKKFNERELIKKTYNVEKT
jgi:hypothetical protein